MKLINAGGISPAAHEMTSVLKERYGLSYPQVIEKLCAFYDDALWRKSIALAEDNAQVQAQRAELVGKVNDDE